MTIRVFATIRITRPHNCFGAALAALLGSYLAGGPRAAISLAALGGGLVVWLIVAACNVVNDLYDLPVDRLRKPDRPLPSGKLANQQAGFLAVVLLVAALYLAERLGMVPLMITAVAALLGLGYSLFLKNTVLIGNGVVGLLSGTTVVYGGLLAGHLNNAVGLAGWLVFFFVFIREILKTIADQEGDALAGLTTVATFLGPGRALRLFYLLALTFAALAALPWVLQLAADRYLIAVSICSILPILFVVAYLWMRSSPLAVHNALRATKLMWFSGLLALTMLR